MELKELYQEIILDHAKNPRNKGKCDGYNHDAKAHNPLCGDKVHIYLKLDKDQNISGLSFQPPITTINSKKMIVLIKKPTGICELFCSLLFLL